MMGFKPETVVKKMINTHNIINQKWKTLHIKLPKELFEQIAMTYGLKDIDHVVAQLLIDYYHLEDQ